MRFCYAVRNFASPLHTDNTDFIICICAAYAKQKTKLHSDTQTNKNGNTDKKKETRKKYYAGNAMATWKVTKQSVDSPGRIRRSIRAPSCHIAHRPGRPSPLAM